MKKVLFLMLMFMGLMSSLYALDTVANGCGIESKSQPGYGGGKSAIVIGQINIWHRDNLMYSCENQDIKLNKMNEHGVGIDLARATKAVVCYPRGVIGV